MTATAPAIVFERPRRAVVADIPIADPGDDGLVVRTTVSAISGTPRNDWKRSSPASRKYLNLGCVCTWSTATGRTCSATSPARPS